VKCGCVCDACDGVKGSMMGDDDEGRRKETFELDVARGTSRERARREGCGLTNV